MLSVFLFLWLKKTDFNFLFRFSFLVFVWNFENGLRFVFGVLFSVYGIKTDNLCLSGNI